MISSPPSLYVHVPFCSGKCAYCNFYSVLYDTDLAGRWLAALEREMEMARQRVAFDSVRTVYFGGGTPSVLNAVQLARLLSIVASRLDPGQIAEVTIEANPGTLTPEKLSLMKEHGVTRISFGAQTFQDRVLPALKRRHLARDTRDSIRQAREAGFENLGLDLIAGLPGVPMELWRADIREALSLAPAHISVYALTIEASSEFARWLQSGLIRIPDDYTMLAYLSEAEQILCSAGFERYEISNYASNRRYCLHNLNCWRGLEYVGFGPAAASRLGQLRWCNRPSISQYIESLESGNPPPRDEETVDASVDCAERLVFAFRISEGVDMENVPSASPEQKSAWLITLNRLAGEGLVERNGNRWRLTSFGTRFADFVASELFSS